MKQQLLTLFLFFEIGINILTGQTYQAAGNLNVPRTDHESQLLNDGTVLTFGGFNGWIQKPYYYRSAELYTRSSNTWAYTDSMKTARTLFASAILNDGRVMAIGGKNTDSSALVKCEWYDPTTGKWTDAPPLNHPRSSHKAVTLPNGNILIAGGYDYTCEIFDVNSNKWIMGPSTVFKHGSGCSLILLSNGKVFINGGDMSSYAELYDPATNTWTFYASTNGERIYSTAVELNDGRVLVYGSTKLNYQNTSEVFYPTIPTFTGLAKMNTNRTADAGILLDDGRVLTYGIGDITNPNTKVIEIYDPASNTWATNTYNFVGSNAYTLTKLFSGELLITAGMTTTGNGANVSCLLINASSDAGCIPPSPSLSVNSNILNACIGKDITITIPSSESGVTYRGMINSIPVGDAVSGGGSINLILPGSAFVLGKNVIRIAASKNGCSSVTLSNTVAITLTQDNTNKPHVVVNGSLKFCDDAIGTTLSSDVSGSGYVWSNGETTASIQPQKTGTYFFRTANPSGCLSLTSDTILVKVLNSKKEIYVKDTVLSVCSNKGPVQLITASADGTWSGPGISPDGLLDPSNLADGVYTMLYTYCSKSVKVKVTVTNPPAASMFTIQANKKKICKGQTAAIIANGTIFPASYELYVNDVKTGNTLTSGTISWNITVTSVSYLKVLETRYNSCGTTVTTRYDTIQMYQDPLVNLPVTIDTTCAGLLPKVKVSNTEVGYKYVAAIGSNQPASDTLIGNGGLLILPLKKGFDTYTIYVYVVGPGGCVRQLTTSAKAVFRFTAIQYATSFTGGLVGETFSIKNTSTADSYIWDIDGNISTKFTPDPFTFSSTGLKKITLYTDSRVENCRDTLTKYLEIVDAPSKAPGVSCEYDTLEKTPAAYLTNNQMMAYHVDKEGNKYFSQSLYYKDGANYAGSYGLILKKFDKNNHLIWEKRHNPWEGSYSFYDFACNYVVDIESDNDGNIYIAGRFYGNYWKWDNMEIKMPFDPQPVPYLVKLNAAGVVQWYIYSPSNQNGNALPAFTDLIYIDDNTIYAAVTYPSVMYFPDGTQTDFDRRPVSVITINKDGKLLKKFSCNKPLMGERLITNYNPDPGGESIIRDASISPKLTLTSNGKLIVSGKSVGALGFNSFTYPVTDQYYTAFAAILNTGTGWEKAIRLYEYDSRLPANFGPATTSTFLTTDALNNIYVSDCFNTGEGGMMNLSIGGDLKKISTGGSFTAKFDNNGKLIWYNPATYIRLRGIAQLSNEVLVYGDFLDFYSSGITNRIGKRSKGFNDQILTSYDLSGKVNWVETVSSDTTDAAFCMTKDRCSDNVYFCGRSKATSYFMNRSLSIKAFTHTVGKYSGSGDCNITTCSKDCAGLMNGNAFLDSCKTCAGGSTGITPVLDPKLCITTTIKEPTDSEELIVYPNPTSGRLNIKANEGILSITIYNAIGEALVSVTISKGNSEWAGDISNLPAGVYFIHAKTNNADFYKKVLIAK